MLTLIRVIHVVLCVFMIFVILLQPGKDAGMGAALGGGAATSAFGGRGAVTFLSKLTAICAGLFFVTSLGLSFVGMRTSVAAGLEAKPPPPIQKEAPPSTPLPAAPGAPEGAEGAMAPAESAPAGGAPAPTTGPTNAAPAAGPSNTAPAAPPSDAPASAPAGKNAPPAEKKSAGAAKPAAPAAQTPPSPPAAPAPATQP